MKFTVEQVMQTYATLEVEADSLEDLRDNYDAHLDGRDDWSYETDYDSAESYKITPVCTGYVDSRGHLSHDGDTCPIHENVPAVVPEHNRYSFVPKENYA